MKNTLSTIIILLALFVQGQNKEGSYNTAGQKHGEWTEWNSGKEEIGFYNNGQKEGLWQTFEEENLGGWEIFLPDNQPKRTMITNYVKGKKEDWSVKFFEDAQTSKSFYQNDRLIKHLTVFDDGYDDEQVKYQFYENKRVEYMIIYNAANEMQKAIHYQYYDNGTIESKAEWNNLDLPHGSIYGFYQDGNLSYTGMMNNGDGEISFYDESGKLTEIGIYKNGKLIETKKN